jgi:hypothetical protein
LGYVQFLGSFSEAERIRDSKKLLHGFQVHSGRLIEVEGAGR